MREWRSFKKLTQQQQAMFLGVSKAYISALETGKRGKPSPIFVDQICVWLGLIWDDAEELKRLANLSHPKPTVDARGLPADAVYLANIFANNIKWFSEQDAWISDPVCYELIRLSIQRQSFQCQDNPGW